MYRILSAEDDTIMQGILKDTLVPAGYELVQCNDGASVMPKVIIEKPDLILLDVNLPDMTGIDVCKLIKADAATRHIPVLMLTGEAREVTMRVEGLDVGAEDYLFKPISPRLLLARIASILKQSVRPTQP